jgi:hypothetical protein
VETADELAMLEELIPIEQLALPFSNVIELLERSPGENDGDAVRALEKC